MERTDLSNRIKKRLKHLKKWAKREGVTYFRFYNRDLPNFPLICDWVDGEVVVWEFFKVEKDRSENGEESTEVSPNRMSSEQLGAALSEATSLPEEKIHIKDRFIQKGNEQYEKRDSSSELRIVQENGLRFELNLSDYTDLGLFPDHRNARQLVRSWSEGCSVLNLFAYTGSFTCYAIAGGAIATTTVDLNNSYCEWAKRNMALNFPEVGPSHRVVKENCLKFVKLDAAKNRYDIIICDPPTFSNSKKMSRSFNVDDDYVDLVKSCIKLLRPGGKLLFSCNSRKFKLDPTQFSDKINIEEITHLTTPEDFKGQSPHRSWVFSN
jgi:23S rRNA G2069 N7-methylase RlmK/C1962 C5-methylase RlmI